MLFLSLFSYLLHPCGVINDPRLSNRLFTEISKLEQYHTRIVFIRYLNILKYVTEIQTNICKHFLFLRIISFLWGSFYPVNTVIMKVIKLSFDDFGPE